MAGTVGLALESDSKTFRKGGHVAADERRFNQTAFLPVRNGKRCRPNRFSVSSASFWQPSLLRLYLGPWRLQRVPIFVVVEAIPEARLGVYSHIGTFGFIASFIIMMILDVAFG